MMKQRLIIRLDDAAEKMDIKKWDMMEQILDKYSIKPLVGVIPDCKDPKMDKYEEDPEFWNKVHRWIDDGWTIAMHGYQHVYDSDSGGINPVNSKSEFAGHTLEVQEVKIRKAREIFVSKGIDPKVFFAPSHTYDKNTLTALRTSSAVEIISDTIGFDVYSRYGFVFIPQQSGKVRRLPFRTVTYCYHPNMMNDKDFIVLESFIRNKRRRFSRIDDLMVGTGRGYTFVDSTLQKIYFFSRSMRSRMNILLHRQNKSIKRES